MANGSEMNNFTWHGAARRPRGNTVRHCAVIAVLAFGTAVPAYANQPPGPGVLFPAILMIPMVELFTALGGAYVLLRRQPKGRFSFGLRILFGVVLFLFGATHEGAGALVTLVLCAFALVRAIRMVIWGVAPRTRPLAPAPPPSAVSSDGLALAAPMAAAHDWRMATAGVAMGLAAVFLCGSAFAFVGYWPEFQEHYQLSAVRRFLAAQLAYGHAQKQQFGHTQFAAVGDDEAANLAEELRHDKNVRIEFSPDHSHFTVLLLPNSRFPHWPYSLFTSQGSYRADESGQIRMIRAHRTDEVCPPDAPVVSQVTENEVVKDY